MTQLRVAWYAQLEQAARELSVAYGVLAKRPGTDGELLLAQQTRLYAAQRQLDTVLATKPEASACGHCNGHGYVLRLTGDIDGDVQRDKLVCPVCNGQG